MTKDKSLEIANCDLKQPAQEPVGVVSWHEGTVMGSIFPSNNMPKDGDKLYTYSHQWQGLTDDEINKIYNNCQKILAKTNIEKLENNAFETFLNGIKNTINTAIFETEQALKEKNTP